jgi:C1A family cysteine protease
MIKIMKNKKFGWIPDLPDARDHLFQMSFDVSQTLPQSIDLSKSMPRVYDQGQLGSCVSNSLAAAFEYCKIKEGKETFMPARLFMYYNQRVMIHTVKSDSGANIRDGIKSLNVQGVCHETIWPYNVLKFTKKPSKQCYTEALTNRILSYQRLSNDINQLKTCLYEGFPFVFGFTVYESFMTSIVAKTGIMPMPNFNTEKVLGGHAICCVGYDDSMKAFKIRNSWGDNWGIGGYFWMPYQYVSNASLSDDFWTIRLSE